MNHSTPILSHGTQGQHRQYCPDTDPEYRKDKCVAIDADTRQWYCHRCGTGGKLDQPHQLSESERQRLQDKRSKAEKRQAAEKQQTALRLRRVWDKFSETGTSEYLTRKGFDHIPGTRYGKDQHGPFMAMPLYGPGGGFRGYHRHYANAKKIAYGTDKRGAYFLLPGNGPVVVCEGLATGYSVAMATGYPVSIAVDKDNIGPVIASLRAVNPKQHIVISADNDAWKSKNYGLEAAYKAARLHSVDVAVPDFAGLDVSGQPTDFDDLRQLAGLAEVARQISQAKPAPEQPQEIKPGVLLKGISEPDKGAELTPEAATAQLKAVISDFLDNPHRDGQPRKFLIRGAAGLGKTSQVRKALLERGISAEIYTPNHKLADEQLQSFRADNNYTVSASWQGRLQTDEYGKPLCQRVEAVKALEFAGIYRVSRLLCGVRPDGKPHDPDNVCPHAEKCLLSGYLSKVREYSQSAVKITQHALLTQSREQGQQPADIAVIDENPIINLINRAAWDTTAILQQGGIISAAAAALIEHKECWLSELHQSHPQALDQVKQWLDDYAPDQPDIEPGMPDNMIQAKAKAFAERKRPRGVWRFAKLLAEALASDAERYNGLWFDDGKIRAAWIARPNRLDDLPVLLLDGTAEAVLLQRIWPELETVEISVKRNAHVIQVWDTACSHDKLTRNPRKLRERIQHFANTLPGQGAVIGPKSFIEQFNASNAEVAHFGNLRGLDSLKSAKWGIIVGRNQPPAHDVEAMARALAPHDFLMLGGGYEYAPGAYCGQEGAGVAVHTHADPIVNTVLRQLREAESEQAIDRLRLVHNTIPKTVYLLSSLPVDVHINELTALDDLLPDYRLAEALSRYPVLPLGRAWLAKNLPDIFETPKAAERWLAQMPQNPINIYKEFGGIYHGSYRMQGKAGKPMKFISKTSDQAAIATELARLHGATVTLQAFEHQTTESMPEVTSPAPEITEAPTLETTVTSAPDMPDMSESEALPEAITETIANTAQQDTTQSVTELLLLDDKRYIRQQLEPVPAGQRIVIYREYCRVWQAAAAAEPNEIQRDNAGRRAANIWLREQGLLWLVSVLNETPSTEAAA